MEVVIAVVVVVEAVMMIGVAVNLGVPLLMLLLGYGFAKMLKRSKKRHSHYRQTKDTV